MEKSSIKPSKEPNSSRNLDAHDARLFDTQRVHADVAFAAITSALDRDSAGDNTLRNAKLCSELLIAYERGLAELRKALSVPVMEIHNKQAREEAIALETKMVRNMVMIEDRLEALSGAIQARRIEEGDAHTKAQVAAQAVAKASKDSTKQRLATISSSSGVGTPSRSESAPPTTRTSSTRSSKPTHTSQSRDEHDKKLLASVDRRMQDLIMQEVVDESPGVRWDDIQGLEAAKEALMQMVILPMRRPDIYTGIRAQSRGLLLFGPPGNGKTMLGKALASAAQATFFSIQASSLVSKFVGDSEKMVRALFTIARILQPSIIFIDEIDSLLGKRDAEGVTESSNRMKNEFLTQIDGVKSNAIDRVFVIGATNRPDMLDDAARRRLPKRLYIGLPDAAARKVMLQHALKGVDYRISDAELTRLAAQLDGYTGSDMHHLVAEAAMQPVTELGTAVLDIDAKKIRPVLASDVEKASRVIRASSDQATVERLRRWGEQYGSVQPRSQQSVGVR